MCFILLSTLNTKFVTLMKKDENTECTNYDDANPMTCRDTQSNNLISGEIDIHEKLRAI